MLLIPVFRSGSISAGGLGPVRLRGTAGATLWEAETHMKIAGLPLTRRSTIDQAGSLAVALSLVMMLPVTVSAVPVIFQVSGPGSGFIQAAPSGLATTFDNPSYTNFATFSDPRLFSPIGSAVTDIGFFVPGTAGAVPAATAGFGAVFSDADASANASLSFSSGNVSLGVSETGALDISVMDDFLYKDPAVLPKPATLVLFGAVALGLGLTARRRSAQR